ncbi:MAG: hypothetical protein Q7S00_03335, partial [bacterium]|nr:hypothetical protein [bacterium]
EEKIAQYTPIANSLTTLCETAGQFSASLVQGGGEFEAACHQGSELTDWISMLEERLHEAKMETTKRHTD